MTEPRKYPNGEWVFKDRIQDEQWYSDYQAMMELAVRNSYGDHSGLLRAFEADFKGIFGLYEIPQKSHERFERWAKEQYSKSLECAEAQDEEDLWERDDIQFPRLLSEMVAIGIPDHKQILELADSMDLDSHEVDQILDRAQREWERIKKKAVLLAKIKEKNAK